jgi:hypothetical protein
MDRTRKAYLELAERFRRKKEETTDDIKRLNVSVELRPFTDSDRLPRGE